MEWENVSCDQETFSWSQEGERVKMDQWFYVPQIDIPTLAFQRQSSWGAGLSEPGFTDRSESVSLSENTP